VRLFYSFVKAAQGGHLVCLKYMYGVEPVCFNWVRGLLLSEAARGDHHECLKWLHHKGCRWLGYEVVLAAASGNLETLKYCLEQPELRNRSWSFAMLAAAIWQRPECMKLLYDFGFASMESVGLPHPVVSAIQGGSVACVNLALEVSGKPPLTDVKAKDAAKYGGDMVEMLRKVGELGVTFCKKTAINAVRKKDAAALKEALTHGAPLVLETFEMAIRNSIECLEVAHKHVQKTKNYPEGFFNPMKVQGLDLSTGSLSVLKYVFANMEPPWTERVAQCTADHLAPLTDPPSGIFSEGNEGWQMALLLARKVSTPLPGRLEELVQVRRKRAIALACVFSKAGKLAGQHPFDAISRIPEELRIQLAVDSHLVVQLPRNRQPGAGCEGQTSRIIHIAT
jgi:hypothetical protein